jgi:hypothetical protein
MMLTAERSRSDQVERSPRGVFSQGWDSNSAWVAVAEGPGTTAPRVWGTLNGHEPVAEEEVSEKALGSTGVSSGVSSLWFVVTFSGGKGARVPVNELSRNRLAGAGDMSMGEGGVLNSSVDIMISMSSTRVFTSRSSPSPPANRIRTVSGAVVNCSTSTSSLNPLLRFLPSRSLGSEDVSILHIP